MHYLDWVHVKFNFCPLSICSSICFNWSLCERGVKAISVWFPASSSRTKFTLFNFNSTVSALLSTVLWSVGKLAPTTSQMLVNRLSGRWIRKPQAMVACRSPPACLLCLNQFDLTWNSHTSLCVCCNASCIRKKENKKKSEALSVSFLNYRAAKTVIWRCSCMCSHRRAQYTAYASKAVESYMEPSFNCTLKCATSQSQSCQGSSFKSKEGRFCWGLNVWIWGELKH